MASLGVSETQNFCPQTRRVAAKNAGPANCLLPARALLWLPSAGIGLRWACKWKRKWRGPSQVREKFTLRKVSAFGRLASERRPQFGRARARNRAPQSVLPSCGWGRIINLASPSARMAQIRAQTQAPFRATKRTKINPDFSSPAWPPPTTTLTTCNVRALVYCDRFLVA